MPQFIKSPLPEHLETRRLELTRQLEDIVAEARMKAQVLTEQLAEIEAKRPPPRIMLSEDEIKATRRIQFGP